jgi:outer membrane lipoprotein SlyB
MKWLQVVLFLVLVSFFSGCASSQSGEVYSRDQARSAQTVELGVVEFVKDVQVEGSRSGLGTVAGGVAGGVLGSTVGGGKGSTLAALGGAALGALAGSAAEEKMSQYNGLEITVKLDGGRVLAVVQENDVMFSVGDRVRVLTGRDGAIRIEK